MAEQSSLDEALSRILGTPKATAAETPAPPLAAFAPAGTIASAIQTPPPPPPVITPPIAAPAPVAPTPVLAPALAPAPAPVATVTATMPPVQPGGQATAPVTPVVTTGREYLGQLGITPQAWRGMSRQEARPIRQQYQAARTSALAGLNPAAEAMNRVV